MAHGNINTRRRHYTHSASVKPPLRKGVFNLQYLGFLFAASALISFRVCGCLWRPQPQSRFPERSDIGLTRYD